MLTHEKIVGIWIGTANLEELHKIVKLAVDIPAHCNRAFLSSVLAFTHGIVVRLKTHHWLHIGFFLKDFTSLSSNQKMKNDPRRS